MRPWCGCAENCFCRCGLPMQQPCMWTNTYTLFPQLLSLKLGNTCSSRCRCWWCTRLRMKMGWERNAKNACQIIKNSDSQKNQTLSGGDGCWYGEILRRQNTKAKIIQRPNAAFVKSDSTWMSICHVQLLRSVCLVCHCLLWFHFSNSLDEMSHAGQLQRKSVVLVYSLSEAKEQIRHISCWKHFAGDRKCVGSTIA